MSNSVDRVEIDFESIPSNWDIKNLDQIAVQITTTINPQSYQTEEFLVYSIPAYYEKGEPEIQNGERILSRKLLISNDTILFGCLNPRVPKVWYVYSNEKKRKISSTEFLALFPIEETDSRFLYHLVWSQYVLGRSHRFVRGSTPSRDRVDKSILLKVNVPFPSIIEQRRIAKILDTADRTITQTERLIEKIRGIKSGLLHDLLTRGIGEDGRVGDPEKNPEEFKETELGLTPKGWLSKGISELAEINGSSLTNSANPDYEIEYLDISSIERPGRVIGTIAMKLSSAPSRARRIVRSGDVIVSTVRPYLKAVAFIENAPDNLIASTGFTVLSPHEQILPSFLFQTILSEPFIRHLIKRMTGSNYPAVVASDVGDYTLPYPPIEEQERISATLSSFDLRITSEESYYEKLVSLKKGLMHDLLTGRVRVKIPEMEKGVS